MKTKEVGLYVLALVVFAGSVFAYVLESRYTGLLPVITYPYRDCAIPLAIVGIFLLAVAFVVRRSSAKGINEDFASSTSRHSELRFLVLIFIIVAFFMKTVSEAIHELLGHGLFVLIFGGRITDFHISVLWPFGLSHIDWILLGETPFQTVWIIVGGILVSLIFSFSILLLLLQKKTRWQLSVPLLWLSFWCYANSTGYLILGGFHPFGDVQRLIQLGVLGSISSLTIGVLLFLAGFFAFSAVLRETLKPFLGLKTKWAVVAFWLMIPALLLLSVIGRGIFQFSLVSAGFIPVLLSYVLEFQIKRG